MIIFLMCPNNVYYSRNVEKIKGCLNIDWRKGQLPRVN